jgi:hypothetical protein
MKKLKAEIQEDGTLKTEEQILKDKMMKQREDEMEKIVVFAREKLLPYLKEQNKSVNDCKIILESLAMTIQQGLFQLLRDNNTSTLKLREKITEEHPYAKDSLGIIGLIENETMMLGVESLQWMAAKIDAILKDENKERKFNDLNINF